LEITRKDKIDVLKIDIEGGEYELIDQLGGFRDRIGQLLIEFHTRLLPDSQKHFTDDAIRKLRDAGYLLFHVSGRGTEFGFCGGLIEHPGNAGR
jgi:hypothetical protein